MARITVVMPQMGESITNGTITKWHKKIGDAIEVDEILLEISTDKVESEIPSPVSGKVATLLFEEGKTVDVGIKIAEIETDLKASVEISSDAPKTEGPKKEELQGAVESTLASSSNLNNFKKEEEKTQRFFTPLVKKMAREEGVPLSDLEKVSGSGVNGRVTSRDLEAYLSKRSTPSSNNFNSVETVLTKSASALTANKDRVEVIVMDSLRKTIAKNMVESKLTAPHVNSISEVDLTHLVKFREKKKTEFMQKEGFSLTYAPFVIYALAMALKEFPLVNSSIEGDTILVKKDINIGVAVAIPGNGLVVPVIKNADNYGITGIARTLQELATKAREKKLKLEEMSGGTFTYTNVGSFGTLLATPIILRPQVGIYATGRIHKKVMAMEDDSIAVRSMMYGTHTYDHRLVDGELGGKFLEAIHRNLASMKPEELFS